MKEKTFNILKDFYDDGVLRKLCYKNDSEIYHEIFFYHSGIINKENYLENGKLEGGNIIYYPDGKTQYIEKEYKNNKLDGYFIVYDKNNQILRKILYIKGKEVKDKVFQLEKEDIKNDDLYNNYRTTQYNAFVENLIKDIEEKYNNLINEIDIDKKNYKNKNMFLKTIDDINPFQKKAKSKRIINTIEYIQKQIVTIYKEKQEELNEKIDKFGKLRINSLVITLKKFLTLFEYMNQKSKLKEYEILKKANIQSPIIEKMKSIEMSAQKFATSTAITAATGAAAIMGVPSAVTTAVGYIGAASTGTAISSLSGAAATNATLAWLGGGSLASGGGGMALGTTILTGITAGTALFVAVAVAEIVANIHYSKKLTESHDFLKKLGKNLHEMKRNLVVIDGIIKRIDELYSLTYKIDDLANEQLSFLEPLVVDFNYNNKYYVEIFQKSILLCKSLSELAKIKLLDENGNLSIKAQNTIINIKKDILGE